MAIKKGQMATSNKPGSSGGTPTPAQSGGGKGSGGKKGGKKRAAAPKAGDYRDLFAKQL